jgi:hypothetical protein
MGIISMEDSQLQNELPPYGTCTPPSYYAWNYFSSLAGVCDLPLKSKKPLRFFLVYTYKA